MSWVGLRYKGVEPLFPEEWNAVIDALDWLYAYFVDIRTKTLNKDALQSIDVDIIPAEDRKYDLGAPNRRWEQVHAYFGYFDGDLFVQGKKVIKDEDPIYIAAFIDQAKVDVDLIKSYMSQTAGNTAATASNTGEIKNQLAAISSKLDTANAKLGDINIKVGDINGKLGDVIASLSEIAADTDLLVVYTRYIDVKLAVIKAKVESIEATTKSIETTTKSIDERVGVAVATLSEIDGKLVSIRDYARSLPDIYAKIVGVSDKLDTTNARLAESVATLSEIDAKVAGIREYVRYTPDIYAKLVEANARLEEANARLAGIQVSLSEIESTVATIESYARELPAIRARTESIDAKIDSVVASLSEIDGKVASIESYARDMPAIRAKTESIDAKLDTTNARLGETVAILTEIDAKVASIRDYARSLPDIYARLVDVGTKLDEANARLAGMQVSLSEINAEVASIETYTRELTTIRAKTESIDTKLDTTNAKLTEIDTTTKSIDSKLSDTLVSLTEIDSKLASIKDYVKYVADKTASIEAKTASIEMHVSSIDTKLDTTNTKLGNIETKVASIDNKFDTQLSTRASEATLKKCCAFDYDFAIRRSGGRLLATLDFTINQTEFGITEINMNLIKVEGSVTSVSIVEWGAEGIPQPEGTGSPYALKVVVQAGGTAYIRIPIKARYWKPFSAYVTLYAKGYDVQVLPYVTLGGILAGYRNKLPRYLRMPADQWGRFMVHWFMEAHHGCAEIVIEVHNPQTVDVPVYIGVVTAGEVEPFIKGFGLLFGWEGGFELDVNNETLTFNIDIMIPSDVAEVAHIYTEVGIVGDGTNPLDATVKIHPGGVPVISASNSSTTPSYVGKSFKVWLGRRGVYPHNTLTVEVDLSTVGTGKLVKFIVVLEAFSKEYTYAKAVSGSVNAGSTVTLVDYTLDVRHVCGGELEITAPSDGSVDILADTPEGEIAIATVPPGTTKTVKIDGRYLYIKIRNNSSTSSASYTGYIRVSESYMPR